MSTEYVVMPKEEWQGILDAFREKASSAELIKSSELEGLISGLENSAQPVLQSKIVASSTEEQTVIPDEGYDGLSDVKVEAMSLARLQTVLTVNSKYFKTDTAYCIVPVATVEQSGFIGIGNMRFDEIQLNAVKASTITPGTSKKVVIKGGCVANGTFYVAGSSYLKAENIKKGVTIFGVTGTYTGA